MNSKRFPSITAAIPALNPDERLVELVDRLIAAGVTSVVIVDDGSRPECRPVFEAAARREGVEVLTFPENRGKGAGLKRIFSWYLENHPEGKGLVTADADGQHAAGDIVRVMAELDAHPDCLVLGVRDFIKAGVPFKSRFGNLITRAVFHACAGARLSDTQTGLRGIPASFLPACLAIRGDRFEYETDMLFAAGSAGVPFREVAIATVYENDNKGSHFHPFRDACKIYRVILRHFSRQLGLFIASSFISAAIDLGLFALFFYLTFDDDWPLGGRLALAVVAARIISASCNYFLNHKIVFRQPPGLRRPGVDSAFGYCLLSAFILLLSYTFTLFGELFFTRVNIVVVKALVDFSIFVLSFFVQKLVIFRRRSLR